MQERLPHAANAPVVRSILAELHAQVKNANGKDGGADPLRRQGVQNLSGVRSRTHGASVVLLAPNEAYKKGHVAKCRYGSAPSNQCCHRDG